MDASNGNIVAAIPIGDECDAVGFDKKLKIVYSSNGDGARLAIIQEQSPDKFEVIQNLGKLKMGQEHICCRPDNPQSLFTNRRIRSKEIR